MFMGHKRLKRWKECHKVESENHYREKEVVIYEKEAQVTREKQKT